MVSRLIKLLQLFILIRYVNSVINAISFSGHKSVAFLLASVPAVAYDSGE